MKLKIGQCEERDGLRFECIALRPHQRVTGELTQVATWRGWCTACGEPFTFDRGITTFKVDRYRCDAHKRPGKPATSEANARMRAGRRQQPKGAE